MEHLKIYFLNIIALTISVIELNAYLQAISLIFAIVYTGVQIYKKLK
jgi:hypothetical protein